MHLLQILVLLQIFTSAKSYSSRVAYSTPARTVASKSNPRTTHLNQYRTKAKSTLFALPHIAAVPVATSISKNIKMKQAILKAIFGVVLDIMHVVKVLLLDNITRFRRMLTLGGTQGEMSAFYAGKTVLITGASSGLGQEMALNLATLSTHKSTKQPMSLVLSARSVDKLEQVAQQCRDICPSMKVMVVPLDLAGLSDEAGGSLEKFMKKLRENLALDLDLEKEKEIFSSSTGLPTYAVDVLINNAGVSSRGMAARTSQQVLQSVMDVNFIGPITLTKAVLADMGKKGNSGCAVGVVSSVQGRLGIPERTSYAASKHALQGYFDSLRGEWAYKDKGISFTVISPGYINTNLSLNAVTSTGDKYGMTDETTRTGMSAKRAAEESLLAIARRESDYVMADAKVHAAIQAKAQFPGLLAKYMNSRMKKEE